ncbi:Uncharacterised protein [Vibrio cholerae]|nr:Uncharacterised protein [Vibrio cholerae]
MERVGSSTACTRRCIMLKLAANSLSNAKIRSKSVTVCVSSISLSTLNANRCSSCKRSAKSKSTSTRLSNA